MTSVIIPIRRIQDTITCVSWVSCGHVEIALSKCGSYIFSSQVS